MINITFNNSILIILISLAVFVFSAIPVIAQEELFPECQGGSAPTAFCETVNKPTDKGAGLFGPNSLVSRLTQTIIFVTGAVAVIMVVVGGLKYVLSNGDPQGTNNAKNTILYAIIGLIIALSAQVILKLVLQRILA